MKMAKKLLALLLALVMVLAIAACTPAGNEDTKPNAGNDTTPKDTEPKDTEEEKEPVTITILTHNDPGLMAGLEEVNKLFMEKYPWITVEIEGVAGDQIGAVETARFAAKDCDIIRGPSFDALVSEYDYIPDGIFSETTSVTRYNEGLYLDLSDVPGIDNWDAAATNRGSYDGKMLSVPTGTVIGNAIWYNKTIFDKYGLEVPTTWDAFMNVCQTLKDNGENVIVTGMLDNWPPMMLVRSVAQAHLVDEYGTGTEEERLEQWCEAMWKGEAAYNDELALECWEKIEELNQYWCEAAFNCNLAAADAEFVNGNAAMLCDGSWALATIAEGAEFEYGMFAIPGDDEPEGGVTAFAGRGDVQWGVCSGTKYPEECKLWIEFYSTPEGYGAFLEGAPGMIPFGLEGLTEMNDFCKSLQPGMQNFYLQLEDLFKSPDGTGQYALWNAGIYLESCLGTMSVQELADAANADWELAMEQAGMR